MKCFRISTIVFIMLKPNVDSVEYYYSCIISRGYFALHKKMSATYLSKTSLKNTLKKKILYIFGNGKILVLHKILRCCITPSFNNFLKIDFINIVYLMTGFGKLWL